MNFEIWMEGYRATGQSSGASKIGESEGETFDDAVRNYMTTELLAGKESAGIEENGRSRYANDEAYENRRSNWSIWACDLFDNEADARKSFG
ncbi:MAG TPA: hypothetical protein ENH60_11985 [Pricia sp.]|nr:hypothetical protein [Pricia sp.]